jgi:uncharacterized protein (TIGR01244 family)
MKVKGKEIARITEALYVGPQPTAEDIGHLAEEGFLTVVNLRTSDEKDMEITPVEEGEIVRDSGLRYSHIPVTIDDLHAEEVDMFRHDVKMLMGPVYVHCCGCSRAGAFAMMHYAVETGLSPEAVFQKAGEMGLNIGDDKMKQFMRRYINDRQRRFEQPDEGGSEQAT